MIGQRRYTTSQLCSLYFVYELSGHIRAGQLAALSTVTVNVFDPGLMLDTDLFRDQPPPDRFLQKRVLPELRPILNRMIGNVN